MFLHRQKPNAGAEGGRAERRGAEEGPLGVSAAPARGKGRAAGWAPLAAKGARPTGNGAPGA